jgi:uncharacterized membrane protein
VTSYTLVAFVHVAATVLGLGQIGALVALAGRSPAETLAAQRLLRRISWSLLLVVLSGVGLVAFTHGALGQARWVRAAFALSFLLGFLLGLLRRAVRRGAVEKTPGRYQLIALVSGTVLLLILFLMVVKP